LVAQNPLVSIADNIAGTGEIEIQIFRGNGLWFGPVENVAALAHGGIGISFAVGVF